MFGSRVTTSTLAGEYVTARDYVGGRASCGNCGTGTSCTRRGLREKLRREMYVLLKKGTADYGARGHYDPPKLWFPCGCRFFFVSPRRLLFLIFLLRDFRSIHRHLIWHRAIPLVVHFHRLSTARRLPRVRHGLPLFRFFFLLKHLLLPINPPQL